MKQIRVLHVINSLQQGGIENFIMNVYRNIDRDKYHFEFAILEREPAFFDDEVRSLGGVIHYFDTNEKTISNYKTSLKRIIQDFGPYDSIHSHNYFFSGYILHVAKQCGVKIRISHAHDTQKGKKRTFSRNCYEHFMRWMIKRDATHMVACSNLAGKYVFGNETKFEVLYNGIDTKRFSFNTAARKRIRDELGLECKKVVLNVGRFEEQKNHAFLLKFFEKIVKVDSTYMLILVGTGSLLDELNEFISIHNLSENIIVLSNILNIEDYYSASDCFVLPSRYEGMPIVSIESQCNGVPTLLSDTITGEVRITDIIDYLGINNECQWAIAVDTMLKRTIERNKYSKMIQDSCFDIHNTVSQLCRIYDGR